MLGDSFFRAPAPDDAIHQGTSLFQTVRGIVQGCDDKEPQESTSIAQVCTPEYLNDNWRLL